ncbi:hypothetical protein [Pseudomonas phage vB_Pae_CF23a]|nr:hypothetical protein DL351_19720 [Pseudomonas aeruginosa]QBI79962.1 hypothetical protein [Pseudomonas phage vB_Pae_CF23a]QBI80050.1 hypothetical protein [Pseudomonas phage vB_Pae_CF57a]QBI80139.1 hypothetical protein [Pseudomonas phage vB_Pae_CF65a]QBI80276.1 hypothetical protein [Pseudomonas phage vB_Pae_CF81a]QBI80363.1 hypothetical protein [Pseudomonas phage vB_Pae_CF118a]QBI80431.1 hypothetical protein [Pseudomonas phage vB_Pae_CF121b]QBI80497.1 hypothetical protein [Pseudomonas phage
MPDMREEFEAWATKHRMPIHRDGVVTDYAARCTDECWQAWKASRAALRVRLPKPYGSSSLDAYPELAEFNRGIRECLAALQRAGIEVKP